MFLGLAGISADQMVLILAGVAGAGTAADQLAVGRAIANLPAFDLSLLSQIPDAAVETRRPGNSHQRIAERPGHPRASVPHRGSSAGSPRR